MDEREEQNVNPALIIRDAATIATVAVMSYL
jgi:hypothetical protein